VRKSKAKPQWELLTYAAGFAARQNPPITYLKDFTAELLTNFRGEWQVHRHALKIQSEQLKQFFKFCKDVDWISGNPAAKLKPAKANEQPVYAFPKEDRDALLKAVAEDNYLLALNLTMRYSALAPVDIVHLKPQNLHQDRIVIKRRKTNAQINVKLPPIVVERLRALPTQGGGHWFWNKLESQSKHETATGNLRRMMRPYFEKAKVYQRDEHGQTVYGKDEKTGEIRPILGPFYQWRHTFVHEHIMMDTPPAQIAEFLGERTWDQKELKRYRKATPQPSLLS
jgi:hypothetical protein